MQRSCRPERVAARRREPSQEGRAARRCPGPEQPGWPAAGLGTLPTRGKGGKLRKSGRPQLQSRGCSEPRRARTPHERNDKPQPRGARPLPRTAPGLAPQCRPEPCTLRTWRPDPEIGADGRRGERGPVAPGGQGSEGGPQAGGRAPWVQRTGTPRPARLGNEPPSEPLNHQGQKSYLWAAGRPGAQRRGDPAGTGVLLGGAQETPHGRKPQLWAPPPPFAGDTEAPRSCGGAHAQTPSDEGQPRPDFPPRARGGGGRRSSLGHLG